MKANRSFWSYLFGGWSFAKVRIWPWKAELWRVRTPKKSADVRL